MPLLLVREGMADQGGSIPSCILSEKDADDSETWSSASLLNVELRRERSDGSSDSGGWWDELTNQKRIGVAVTVMERESKKVVSSTIGPTAVVA